MSIRFSFAPAVGANGMPYPEFAHRQRELARLARRVRDFRKSGRKPNARQRRRLAMRFREARALGEAFYGMTA